MKFNPFEKYLTKEDKLQREVCRYVLMNYNTRIIPMNTEGRKSKFEQFKFKQTGGFKGILDLFLPIASDGYYGLFIELKAEGTAVFKKDGEIRASKNDHLLIQLNQINEHKKNGYFATFCVGFDQCKDVIDNYLKGTIKNKL